MRPIIFLHFANAQSLAINIGLCTEHTIDQLLLAHFQAEEGHTARVATHAFVRPQSHILHNIQG